MKKVIICIVSVIIIIFVALFLSTGGARTDVHLRNYQVSEDGKTMIITVDLSSSAGYIRDMKQKNDNGDYYLTFYSTFGINSKLGAKDTFTLELDSNVDEIYFFKGKNDYRQVLQKDKVTGKWYTEIKDNEVTENFELREYDFLMKGKNNTTLFIKSVDSDDYDELIKTLYPNGIVDWQGQEIGIVENAEEVRKKFIDEHTTAFTVINGITKEVELEKFYVDLKEISNELYFDSNGGDGKYLCYKATVDNDIFIFPSEWGSQPFGFIEVSEDSSYYTYTSWGIWKINTENLLLDKLTSDEYEGKTYLEIIMTIPNDDTVDNEGTLCWIDQVQISPDNNIIVYRSNRGSKNLSETSIWKLDLKTRVEEKVLIEDLYNNIDGFASNDVIVVGSAGNGNTRLVNLTNLNVKKIEIPNEPNVSVQGVKNGKLFYTTYENGSTQTTTVLNELDIETGKLTELQRLPLRYKNLIGNIEYITFDDMLYLQNDVDNGHYSWRLKPEDVVREYWYALYGISDGEISDAQYIGADECIIHYILNNQEYVLSLTRPIKKGDAGIWIIRDCNLSLKEELVQMAYQKALEILNEEERISIETSQVISYEDENTCDIEFPISNNDYFIRVTYTCENNTADWKFSDIKKLTTNQVKDFEYYSVLEEEKVRNIIVEGMQEEVNYEGTKSSLGYTIQYDEETLNLTRENEKDIYRANNDDIKDKVYFAVEYLNKSYEDLKNENKDSNIEEIEVNGQKAFIVTYIDNVLFDENNNFTWKWDSDVKTLWYIDANDGTYFIEEHYFYEATEGWGIRLNQMINTLKIDK